MAFEYTFKDFEIDLNDLIGYEVDREIFWDAEQELGTNFVSLYKNEISILFFYTDTGYERLNHGLRAGMRDEYTLTLERVLNFSLDNLYVNRLIQKKTGICYRYLSFNENYSREYFVDHYKKGAIIRELSFLSTGKNLEKVKSVHEGDVLFNIISKNGFCIQKYSKHGEREEEVLFKSQTEFKVIDSFFLNDTFNIYLKEENNYYEYFS